MAPGCTGQTRKIYATLADWQKLGYTVYKAGSMEADAQAKVAAAEANKWDLEAVKHVQITPTFIGTLGLHPNFTFKHTDRTGVEITYPRPMTLLVQEGKIVHAALGRDVEAVLVVAQNRAAQENQARVSIAPGK
jgi:peroxiredoxin